jgi:heat shock protein HtpX
MFIEAMPFVFIGTGIWFLIAYWGHSAMIDYASGSKTLERKENMRVYNLTENLCMGVGMKMPKLKIIETDALNAFASGLNEKNYSVTLTRGIINKLDDDELEGVIAHELMHIRNKDVKLLVISIIFVGIFSLIIQIAFRSLLYGSMTRSRRKDGKGGGGLIIVILVVSLVAYLISLLFKFALSRKREFMADAGAAEMTRNPLALANALRKISGNSKVDSVKSDDVKEMFIDNGPDDNSANFLGGIGGLFATHPPIKDRISVLEQF